MIVYGDKSTQIAKELLTERCSSCDGRNCLQLYIFQEYHHVFFIPFVPSQKLPVVQCDQCKKVWKIKGMPPALKAAFLDLKPKTRTPLWTFSGLAIIGALIIAVVIGYTINAQKNKEYILAPQRGDIYEVKISSGEYTLYKVERVESATVFIRKNLYETNIQSGLENIKKKGPSVYEDDLIPFSKGELKVMLEKDKIVDIDR